MKSPAIKPHTLYVAGTLGGEPMNNQQITAALHAAPNHPAVRACLQVMEQYAATADAEANDEDNILKGTSTHYQMARSMFVNCLVSLGERIGGFIPESGK